MIQGQHTTLTTKAMIFCPLIYTTRHQLPPAHHEIVCPAVLDTVAAVPRTRVTVGYTVLFVAGTIGPLPEMQRKTQKNEQLKLLKYSSILLCAVKKLKE